MDTTTSPPTERPAPAAITPLLRSVVLCDLVDSTALAERIGDVRIAELMQAHDRLLLRLLLDHQGQLIDKADGVLALFERPVNATAFALAYQRGLRDLGQQLGQSLQARVGIHVGDVMTWTNSPADVLAGAKPVEVEGLAKPVAARLMGLALPGQILMSGMAQNLAQRAQGELGHIAPKLLWRLHGRYRFKGVPAPMLVHEVGELGIAPLRPPVSTEKAWRELPLWRKPPVLALEAVLAVSLAVGGVWSMLKSPPAIAFNERDWVVVADFNNLTGETLYDEALDTALRVGLEQSRYVNVMSDLQIERALQRMQATGRLLDRQAGVELALREGAKALIVPTISHSAGRPKVALELVDPTSGVTVRTHMAESAAGGGVVSALGVALTELREELGESLPSIENSSAPLEQVTTSNLEALRAFSLGLNAVYENRLADAQRLYVEALTLDPDFSMAYLRLGYLLYSQGDYAESTRMLTKAEAHKARLTQREALFLDAGVAAIDRPEQVVEALKALGELYPDEYRAHYNLSYFAHHDLQRYDQAADVIVGALDPRNVRRPSAFYLQGTTLLALNKTESARESFAQSDLLGTSGFNRGHADAFAVERDFIRARQIANNQQVSSSSTDERIWASQWELVYPLDSGDVEQALRGLETLQVLSSEATPLVRDGIALMAMSACRHLSSCEAGVSPKALASRVEQALAVADPMTRRHRAFQLLAVGWLAAKQGEIDTAQRSLSVVSGLSGLDQYPAISDMQLVLQTEMDIRCGAAAEALTRVRQRLSQGGELYFLHVAAMRAAAASGAWEQARTEANWLAQRRGLAYAEFNSQWVWQAANVLASNQALACAAEYSRKLDDPEAASKAQERFVRAWPSEMAQSSAKQLADDTCLPTQIES